MKINKNNKHYYCSINNLINRFTLISLEHLFFMAVLNNYEKDLTVHDLKNIDFKKPVNKDHDLYFKYLYFKRKMLKLAKAENTHYAIQNLHGTNYIYLTTPGLRFINVSRKAFKPSYMRAIHYEQTALVCIKYHYTFSIKYPSLDVQFLTDYEIKAHPIYAEYKAKPDLLIIFNNNNSKNKNIAIEIELTLKNNISFNNKLNNLKYCYNDFNIIFFSDNQSVINYIKKHNEISKANDTFGVHQEVFTREL